MKALLKLLLPVALLAAVIVAVIVQSAPASLRVAGGALLGLWLDRVAPQGFSWTLALLLGGVVVGVFIAWGWVLKEGNDDDRS